MPHAVRIGLSKVYVDSGDQIKMTSIESDQGLCSLQSVLPFIVNFTSLQINCYFQ